MKPVLIGRTPDGRPLYSCDYDLLDPEIDVQVSASLDDARMQETAGAMMVALTEVWVRSSNWNVLRYWGGLRFREGPFPAQGSDIIAAHLTILPTAQDDANLDIYCEAAQRPLCFSEAAFDISGRDRTAASIPWVADNLGAGWVNSPSLVPIVQEVVDVNDPASLVFILKPKEDIAKSLGFYSWDEAGNISGAKLHLEWAGASFMEDQPDQQSDDATEVEDPGTVNITWNWAFVYSHADATSRRWGGFRFRNGPFPPKGVTVTEAKIVIRHDVQDNANFDIYAEKAASPATFVAAGGNISGRDRTIASVPWVEDGLGIPWGTSPSIVPVIQELVDAYDSTEIAIILKPKENMAKTLDPVTYDMWSSACIDPGLMSVKLRVKWVPAAPPAGGSRHQAHIMGSRLGLPSLPQGWRRRPDLRGLALPAGY